MRKLSMSFAATVALAVSSHAMAQSLDLCYDMVDLGNGLFEYSFVCETDAGWVPGMGWRWYIFGDQQSATSPLTNVAMTSSFPIGPWIRLQSTSGFHNGPTFGPVLDYWIPASGSETLEWSCTSPVPLRQGELLFSTIAGTLGGAVGPTFKVATMGCPSACPCACDFDTSTGPGVCDIVDFTIFAGLFAGGDPCACDLDTSTGPGVCDIVDFTTFAGQFAGGCP